MRAAATAAVVALAALATASRRPELERAAAPIGKRARPDHSLPARTARPLIGVLSQPGDPATGNSSYIAASYVKLIEAAGARAVPFFHDAPDEETERRLALVNGFLIPGGAATLRPGHTFFDVAEKVVRAATARNAHPAKDHFPVLAICLGFEAMSVALSGNASLLSRYDAEDGAAPLFFTAAARGSSFFGSMPATVLDDLETKPYARESHTWGVSLEALTAEPGLRDAVDVLSLSADPEGRVYVSSYEHRTLPFAAVQWHPEKNAFEWGDKLHIPHTDGALAVTHAVARWLSRHARASAAAPRDVLEEDDALIYNHPAAFTGRHENVGDRPWLDQAYVLPPWVDWDADHPPRRGERVAVAR